MKKSIRSTFAGVAVFGRVKLQACHLSTVKSSHVSPEDARQPKDLSTQRALVRLHTGVDTTVPRQQSRPREPLVTDGALKCLLTSMNLHVVLENTGAAEGAVTHSASVHGTHTASQ